MFFAFVRVVVLAETKDEDKFFLVSAVPRAVFRETQSISGSIALENREMNRFAMAGTTIGSTSSRFKERQGMDQ
jgi:hypothetical protein